MPIGQDIIGQSSVKYDRKKQGDIPRMMLGLQKVREALISNAKLKSSQETGLPKDWRNRVFK